MIPNTVHTTRSSLFPVLARQPVGRVAIVSLAVGLAAVGAFATKAEVGRRQLTSAYAGVQRSVTQLEQERAALMQELEAARQTTAIQADDIQRLQTELTGLEMHLGRLHQELAALQQERAQAAQANARLTEQLALTAEERDALQAKLSSLSELRAAIRAVKRRLRWERWQAFLARVQRQRQIDQVELMQGNRGFMVRGGVSTVRPTSPSPTVLQVRVHEPEVAP